MDKTAFSSLYMEMMPGLYRLALSMLHNTADAEDAVQQAALKAWQVSGRIRPGGERMYVTRILINVCHDIQRQRMRAFPVSKVPEGPEQPQHEGLKDALDRLPEKLRTPLLLMYLEGWSEREIASMLRMTPYAVKSRLRRGRAALAEILHEEEVV